MPADVVCMALGPVPSGEQRSRFLAVGLNDDTVRIISLDPNVSSIFLRIITLILIKVLASLPGSKDEGTT